VFFDAIRVGLSLFLTIKLLSNRRLSCGIIWLPLIVLLALFSLITRYGPGLAGVAFLLVAAVLGHSLGQRPLLARRLLLGFSIGATISATAIILEVVAGLSLGPVRSAVGSAGLSYRTTAVSYEVAIGAGTAFWSWQTERRWWLLWSGMICFFGTLLSGGRAGFVGFVGATIALRLVVRSRRLRSVVGVALLIIVSVPVIGPDAPTIYRFMTENPNSDFFSGRLELQREAVTTIVNHPLYGMGSLERQENSGINVHNAVLKMGVVGGLLAAGAMLAILIAMVRELVIWIGQERRLKRLGSQRPSSPASAPLLVIYLIYCVTSTGPTAGVSPAFMMGFLLSAAMFERRSRGNAAVATLGLPISNVT
jgi:O-antigen ligase